MTDADLDARVLALSDEDVRAVAENTERHPRLSYWRPRPLLEALAKEVLRLRGEVETERRHRALAEGERDRVLEAQRVANRAMRRAYRLDD